jgi:hypothetical protein
MGKLQVRLHEQKEQITDVYRRYRVTISAMGLLCLLMMVYNITHSKNDNIYEHICDICAFTAIGSFFVESLAVLAKRHKDKNQVQVFWIIGNVSSLILAIFWTVLLLNAEESVSATAFAVMSRLAVFYALALGLGGLYVVITSTGLSVGAYGRNVIFNLLRLFFVLLAVNIGLVLVFLLFDSLIASLEVWDWLENIELLLSAFVYSPLTLMYVADIESQRVQEQRMQESRFVRNFLRFALMPLVCAATVIIYMYMVKVLVGATELSNVIFSPCMWLFIIGAPIWEMASEQEISDGKTAVWDKIINSMPYIYAPFILLEIYSMGSRIAQYGFTVERYAAVMFIIFQIVYVAWDVVWNVICERVGKKGLKDAVSNKSGLVIAVIILLFIALVIPGVNAEYVSFASQKSRFDKSYKKAKSVFEKYGYDEQEYTDGQDYADAKLTEDERHVLEQFTGAYDYLEGDARGKSYVKKGTDKNQISSYVSLANDILRWSGYESGESWDYLNFNRYSELKSIDIFGGYNRAYVISLSDSDECDRAYYEKYELPDNSGDYTYSVTVDLTPLIDALELENDGEYSGLPEDEPYEIIIDSKAKLVITGFMIDKLSGGYRYKGLYIRGYLLEK